MSEPEQAIGAELIDNDIAEIRVRGPRDLVLEDVIDLFARVGEFDAPQPMLTIVDFGEVRTASLQARRYAQVESVKFISAAALLVQNPVARVIATVFAGLNNPGYPIKLFSNRDMALAWLREIELPVK